MVGNFNIYIKQTNYAYDEFIGRHDTAEERVSVLNDGSKKLSRLKCEGKKDLKERKIKYTYQNCVKISKCNICIINVSYGEEEKQQKKYFK